MRKFFCLLLILLMFMSVFSCCTPVYAEDYESYTLEPGKVYGFKFDYLKDVDLVFSDNVLYGIGYNYDSLRTYDSYGNSYSGKINMPYAMFVYNCFDSEINMTVNEGEIMDSGISSPFTLVMFDASEEVFEIKNISGVILDYKVHYYNEDTGSIDFNTGTKRLSGGPETLEGKGVLMFEFTEDELPYKLELNGAYEVGDYISEDFFPVPPWILRMDLTGTIRVLLAQLSTLLPAALVVLSIFLLASFLIYIVHLFL